MSLDIRIYQRPFQPHAGKAIQALLDGFKRHGAKAEWMHQSHYKPSDLAVIWGVRFPNIIQGQKQHGGDYLVLERGYFRDRMNYFSLGYNGLNGKAMENRWQVYLAHGPGIRRSECPGDQYQQLV